MQSNWKKCSSNDKGNVRIVCALYFGNSVLTGRKTAYNFPLKTHSLVQKKPIQTISGMEIFSCDYLLLLPITIPVSIYHLSLYKGTNNKINNARMNHEYKRHSRGKKSLRFGFDLISNSFLLITFFHRFAFMCENKFFLVLSFSTHCIVYTEIF